MKLMRLMFAVVLLFTFSSVFADSSLASVKDKDGNDLTLAPGETVDAYLFIDYSSAELTPNDDSFTDYNIEGYSGLIQSMELKFQLPDGFELVSDPVYVEGTCNYPSTAKIDGSDGVYLITNSNEEGVLLINKGALFKFQIKAPSTITVSDDPYVGQIVDFFITSGNWESLYAVEESNGDEPISFNIYVKEATAETEKVTLAKEYNTYIPTKDLDFSGVEGIKAYYVTAVTSTEATLTETATVAAGEGIIISGTPDEYEVPVAAEAVEKSTANLLKTSGIAENDYILYDGQFVLCSDGTLADGKAYLPASAITYGAKVITLVFGESTGINEIQKAKADGAIYSISGVRVAQPQKGVYIMNGRKVIVK